MSDHTEGRGGEVLTITEAGALLRRGALTSVELVERCLRRIEQVDPTLRACVTVMRDAALSAAHAADETLAAGDDHGPLHGMPLGIKDLIQTRGVLTTAGSRVLSDWIPDEDATVITRLREAAAIALCKTNTHEFAFGTVTAPTRNPWDVERIPGGSSGGSAAGLAAGEFLGALGTDTGGSIRIPAAACGVTGHKPTFGLVSRAGIVPLSWSLDHAGPIAHSAEDCALLLDALAGYDAADPDSVSVAHPGYAVALRHNDTPEAAVRGLRIGVPVNYFFRSSDPQVVSAVRAAIHHFEGLGAVVMEVRVPDEIDEMFDVYRAVQKPEAYTYHRDNGWLDTRRERYSPETLNKVVSGDAYTASDYIHAQQARQRFTRDMRALMNTVDALMTPTLPLPARRVDELETPSPFDERQEPAGETLRYTFPFDLTGQPALTVPCGFTEAGLPIGLQIITPHFADARALRLGHAYQRVTDWHLRVPVVGRA